MNRKTRLIQRISVSSAVMVGVLFASTASAITIKHESYDYWHQYFGEERTEVGQITAFDSVAGAGWSCSGTVTANQWILTAAHCLNLDANSADSITFEVGGQNYVGDAWYVPDTWSFALSAGNDIALIHVDTPFAANLPRRDYNRGAINPIGEDFELVGYGITGSGIQGSIPGTGGTKRSAWNIADGYLYADIAGTKIISSDFDVALGYDTFRDPLILDADFSWGDDGPLVFEGGVASGDSGGPDMLAGAIIAVHSFGLGATLDGFPDSSFTDIVGATNTAPWGAWLDSVIAGDGTLVPIAGTSTGSPNTPLFDPGVVPELVRINTEAFLDYLAAQYPGFSIGAATNSLGYFIGPMPVGVPEPTTLGFFGVGVLMLLRRRSRA